MNKLIKGQNDLETWCKQNNRSDLLAEWNYDKNYSLRPSEVSPGADKKKWWICSKGHEWEANIYDRTKGVGCPYCANKKVLKGYNDLYTTNPELASEMDTDKYGKLTPDVVCIGSGKKVWWKCQYGHEWEAKIVTRAQGHGCPY